MPQLLSVKSACRAKSTGKARPCAQLCGRRRFGVAVKWGGRTSTARRRSLSTAQALGASTKAGADVDRLETDWFGKEIVATTAVTTRPLCLPSPSRVQFKKCGLLKTAGIVATQGR